MSILILVFNLNTFLEAVFRGEVKKVDGQVLAAPALHDALLRVAQQAAQLAGRGEAWQRQRQQQ